MAKGPGLLSFHSLQNVVVSCGEGFTALRKGSFVSRIVAAISTIASSETPAPTRFHLKAQRLRTTQPGLGALVFTMDVSSLKDRSRNTSGCELTGQGHPGAGGWGP